MGRDNSFSLKSHLLHHRATVIKMCIPKHSALRPSLFGVYNDYCCKFSDFVILESISSYSDSLNQTWSTLMFASFNMFFCNLRLCKCTFNVYSQGCNAFWSCNSCLERLLRCNTKGSVYLPKSNFSSIINVKCPCK